MTDTTTATPLGDFTLGLDLGQAADYSALVAVESRFAISGTEHDVRHIKRWPLGTTYPTIVAEVVTLLATPPLEHAQLWVDGTGVGRPVVDLFRDVVARDRLNAVIITAGSQVNRDDGYYHVPKKDLVGSVQAPLQAGRLKFAAADPNVTLLTSELTAFRVTITAAANVTYESWRERDHDDLVLALAIALWGAARAPAPLALPIGIEQRSPWNIGTYDAGASRWRPS